MDGKNWVISGDAWIAFNQLRADGGVGPILIKLDARLQEIVPLTDVATECLDVVSRGQRVRGNPNANSPVDQLLEKLDASVRHNQVRRLDQYRLLRASYGSNQLIGRLAATPEARPTVVLSGHIADESDIFPVHRPQQRRKVSFCRLDGSANGRCKVCRIFSIGVQLLRAPPDVGCRNIIELIRQDPLHWNCVLAVPEFVEIFLHVRDRGPDQEYIAITKIVFVVEVEVLVCHVATASDSDDSIENRRLVMHALIYLAKLGQGIFKTRPKTDPDRKIRVVDSDLRVGVRRQQQQRPSLRIDQQVVDKHSHGYAALSRAKQLLGGQDADIVGAPDEILHVDRLDGVLCQPRAADQRFFAFLENVDAGL